MVSANSISVDLYRMISKHNKVICKNDIIELLKAQKNKTEIKGMKNAHIRDGATLSKFIYWVKKSMKKKNRNDNCVLNK